MNTKKKVYLQNVKVYTTKLCPAEVNKRNTYWQIAVGDGDDVADLVADMQSYWLAKRQYYCTRVAGVVVVVGVDFVADARRLFGLNQDCARYSDSKWIVDFDFGFGSPTNSNKVYRL